MSELAEVEALAEQATREGLAFARLIRELPDGERAAAIVAIINELRRFADALPDFGAGVRNV